MSPGLKGDKAKPKSCVIPLLFLVEHGFILYFNVITLYVGAQSCLTPCDPMDCSLPGSSVRGIPQARTLEWVAISSSRGSSWPRDRSCVSCIDRRFLYCSAAKPLLDLQRVQWLELRPGVNIPGGRFTVTTFPLCGKAELRLEELGPWVPNILKSKPGSLVFPGPFSGFLLRFPSSCHEAHRKCQGPTAV